MADGSIQTVLEDEGLDVQSINSLFDNALFRLREQRKGNKVNEYTIFREALGDTDEMHRAFSLFLHHVKLCPTKVVEYCQQILAPKA